MVEQAKNLARKGKHFVSKIIVKRKDDTDENRAVSFLIALLCAIGLAYVVTVVNPGGHNSHFQYSSDLYGEEELQQIWSLIITEGADTMVSVEVTGKRADLKNIA